MALYSLLCEGFTKDHKHTGPDDRKRQLKKIEVLDKDIPSIMTDEEAISAVNFYQRFKRLGMPYGPWGINPNILVQIVEVIGPLDDLYHPPVI